MRGHCGTLIWSSGAARSLTRVHLSGRVFEQGMTASQPSNVGWTAAQAVVPCLQQSARSKVAEITARGALHQVDGELEQTNFPRVVHALDNRAERFILIFDLPPGAIDHRVD